MLCPLILPLERLILPARPVLDVLGDAQVGHAAPAHGRADGLVDRIIDVRRADDALVVNGHVHEELDQVHVLLEVGADEVVEGVPGDGQHRHAIALGVVETVEQVDAAWPGGGQAHAEVAGVLGVATSGKGGRFLVPDLHKPDLLLALP